MTKSGRYARSAASASTAPRHHAGPLTAVVTYTAIMSRIPSCAPLNHGSVSAPVKYDSHVAR